MDAQPQLTERQADAYERGRLALKETAGKPGSVAALTLQKEYLRAALAYVLDAMTPGGADDHA